MKNRVSIIIFILVCITTSYAQGGFGGLTYKLENFNQNGIMLIGGSGAWLINKHFYLGGGGYSSLNTVRFKNETFKSMGFGGLKIGYMSPLSQLILISGHGMFGSGGYSYANESERFSFFEPSINLRVRINDYIQLSAGFHYRFSFTNADHLLSSKELSSPGVNFSLFFGSF